MAGMRDEDLDRLLGELRARTAGEVSPEFTARVLSRLNGRAKRGGTRLRRVALLGTALVAGAFVTSGYWIERYERSRTAERVQSLRREYRELREELDKLRSLASELEPVVDLGGTDDVDFVLDLRELAREAEDSPGEMRAEPVSHSERP